MEVQEDSTYRQKKHVSLVTWKKERRFFPYVANRKSCIWVERYW